LKHDIVVIQASTLRTVFAKLLRIRIKIRLKLKIILP